MKIIIKPTDSQLHNIIRESISEVIHTKIIRESIHKIIAERPKTLKEGVLRDGGSVNFTTYANGTTEIVFKTFGKYSKESADAAYNNLIERLKPFINTAAKNGYQMMLSQPESNTNEGNTTMKFYFKIVDGNGNISQKITNDRYEYCATVVPIMSNDSDSPGKNIPALVTMAPKYKNSDISSMLKNTTTNEKCAGCGRTINRAQYVVYIDKSTNQILKLGTNCAVNKFGYTLNNNFLNRIAMMFSSCSYHDLVAHDPDGFPIQPSLALRSLSNSNYTNTVMKSIAYHAMTEQNFNIKSYGYDKIKHDAKMMTIPSENGKYYEVHGKDGHSYFLEFTPQELQMREWYKNNGDKIPSFEEYVNFWEKKEPIGDWESTCKTVALAMAKEAFVPKKNVEKFEKILPYTILMFIKQKNEPEPVKTTLKPGDQITDVSCRLIETQYMPTYQTYLVKLKDKEGHIYSYWSKYDTKGLGDKNIIIQSATVKALKGNEININYVKIVTEEKQQQIAQRNQEIEKLQYPEDKTRLRNVQMTVSEIKTNMQQQPSTAIVTDDNGCNYYIFLIKSYLDFGQTVIDFPYQVGDKINVTGTVEKKNGRNGIYYSLSRVKLN